MQQKKCRLCGGALADGRCTLCGLDNSIYDRYDDAADRAAQEPDAPAPGRPDTREPEANPDAASRREPEPTTEPASRREPEPTTEPADQQPPETPPVSPKARQPRDTAQNSRRFRRGTPDTATRAIKVYGLGRFLILGGILLIAGLSALIRGIFADRSDPSDVPVPYLDLSEDQNIYGEAVREIPAEGSSYEIRLGNGRYRVGVHLPEGIYRLEAEAGDGAVNVTDEVNSIYHSAYMGTDPEAGQVTETDGLRLYNGAELDIASGIILRLSTDNAQPLEGTPSENPVTETFDLPPGTYTVGDTSADTSGGSTLPAGMYDISAKTREEDSTGSGYTNLILEYSGNASEYLWIDGPEYTVATPEYSFTQARNIVLPAGTELTVEYGDAVFAPSPGYYDGAMDARPY